MPSPLLLSVGQPHPHLKERLGTFFDYFEVDRADILDLSQQDTADVKAIVSMGYVPNALIDACPKLEIISSFGVGYDGIDAQYAALKHVMVCHTPDVLSAEVADVTIGLLLNTIRQLPRAENYLRSGAWAEKNYPLTHLTLRKRHVGIHGLGRIGLEVAKRLEGFGVEISYHSRRQKPSVPYPYCASLLDLAQNVDTLISIVPGGPDTEKSIHLDIFKALGSNGVFINVGRGSTVDEDALIHALESKIIAAAGLDVFANEPHFDQRLLAFDNLSLLPHVASASEHTRDAMADLQADNLLAWFEGKPVLTAVPETQSVGKT